MPRSLASVCRVQLPERTQLVHSESCVASSSSMFMRRAARTLGLLVRTTMPSSTVLLHAATSWSMPSTSTTQTRQAPISLRSLR